MKDVNIIADAVLECFRTIVDTGDTFALTITKPNRQGISSYCVACGDDVFTGTIWPGSITDEVYIDGDLMYAEQCKELLCFLELYAHV